MANKCHHGRDKYWCCECRYGKIYERKIPVKERDFIDEVNSKNGYSLIGGFNLKNSNR
jgi:hypothetical protein